MISLVLFLRVWEPKTIWRFPHEAATAPASLSGPASSRELLRAWTPFVLLILFVGNWGVAGTKTILDHATLKFPMSGLDHAIEAGGKALTITYSFAWLAAAGTAIFAAAVLAALLLRMPARQVGGVLGETLRGLRRPLVTLASIVGFAYLANYSGMSLALGNALTVTGHFFPLVAPVIGWIGVFVSGSDTSSNALFSNMQRATATHLGLNPLLTIAANTDGGVIGKMISPQSIAVATASSHLTGQEGQLFRLALPHSLGLLSLVCLLTYLQAYHLAGMVPPLPTTAFTAAKPGMAALGVSGLLILGASALILAGLAVFNLLPRAAEERTP